MINKIAASIDDAIASVTSGTSTPWADSGPPECPNR